MTNQITVKRSFSIPASELFIHFTNPKLLEKWSMPDGMTLKVPFFEANQGGRYKYEHTSSEGLFVCEGHIEQIIPNQKLKMVDDYIKDPKGKMLGEKLSCEITFRQVGKGTEVIVTQAGFKNPEFVKECEKGWNQCLNKLQAIVGDAGLKEAKSA